MSASQSLAADIVHVSSTVCKSKVERLITLSTSAVAVCCCSDSAQLIEQAGVLDGNDSLLGEIGHQFDLLVRERADLLAKDGDGADEVARVEHRHVDDCASTGEVGDGDDRWIALKVRRLRPKIVGVRYLLGPGDMSKTRLGMRAERLAKTNISIRRRYVVECDVAKCVSIVQAQGAELGVAEPCCVRQHRLEHRLQLARRTRDDAQHLRGCGLLLQRLGELPFQLGQGFTDVGRTRSRLRSARTKLATVRSALRPLARQGHPVGTVHRTPSGRTQPRIGPSILTEPHDELAPLHSITSSARASSVGGTSRPSAFAVLRLITVRTSSAPAPAGRQASRPLGCGRRNRLHVDTARSNRARRRPGHRRRPSSGKRRRLAIGAEQRAR